MNVTSGTDLAIAIGTIATAVVAAGVALSNWYELRKEKRMGLSFQIRNASGDGFIENRSRVDYKISLEKIILIQAKHNATDPGLNKDESDIFSNIFDDIPNERKILELMNSKTSEQIIPKQKLSSAEGIEFRVHNIIDILETPLVFVALRFRFDSRSKIYIYKFFNRNAGAKLIPQEYQDRAYPYDNWVRIYSFDEHV